MNALRFKPKADASDMSSNVCTGDLVMLVASACSAVPATAIDASYGSLELSVLVCVAIATALSRSLPKQQNAALVKMPPPLPTASSNWPCSSRPLCGSSPLQLHDARPRQMTTAGVASMATP